MVEEELTMKPVGIAGLGVVGGTLAEALQRADVPVRVFDPYRGRARPDDLASCEVAFVSVPTPRTEPSGGYDLSAVWSALRSLEPHLDHGAIVAVKSTVPPGTGDRLAQAFPGLDFASVPEFLVQDRPMETLTRPDRTVIGAESTKAAERLTTLMRMIAPTAPIVLLGRTEAEMVKLASNAMLAAKVALANELGEICRHHGIEWARVQAAVGLDRRIGPDHLSVSSERGFGGACLPKDLDGLIAAARGRGHEPTVLAEIASFNRRIRHVERSRGRRAPERLVGIPAMLPR